MNEGINDYDNVNETGQYLVWKKKNHIWDYLVVCVKILIG